MGINLKAHGWDDVKAAENPENESEPEDYADESFYFKPPKPWQSRKTFDLAKTVAEIKTVDADFVASRIGLQRDKRGEGYICPSCGNGAGSDGDGIKPQFLSGGSGHFEWYCFKCHRTWDNLALCAEQKFGYSINEDGTFVSTADFPKAVKQVAELLGVYVDDSGNATNPHKTTQKFYDDTPDDNETKELKDYTKFYEYARGNLHVFMKRHGLIYRGIPDLVYDYFYCGWTATFSKAKTPAFIVPASKHSFLARFTGDKNDLTAEQQKLLRPKYHSPGPKPVFNLKRATESSDPVIWVSEGEFNAMSIFWASVYEEFVKNDGILSLSKTPHYNVIALAGSEVTRRQKVSLAADVIGKKNFIVALDNDDAGEKGTPKVIETLKSLGHNAIAVNISDKYNDANDFLQAEHDRFCFTIKNLHEKALEQFADVGNMVDAPLKPDDVPKLPESKPEPKPAEPPKPEKPALDPKLAEQIQRDIFKSNAEAVRDIVQGGKFQGKWAGLTANILRRHKTVYKSSWSDPDVSASFRHLNKDVFIVPTSSESYCAYKIEPMPSGDIMYFFVGNKRLFKTNDKVLNSTKPIFVVESYLSAMSVEFCDRDAVAIGTHEDYQLLVDELKNRKQKPPVIILLDADENGRETAEKLHAALDEIGVQNVVRQIVDWVARHDCNSILRDKGADYLSDKLERFIAEFDVKPAPVVEMKPEPAPNPETEARLAAIKKSLEIPADIQEKLDAWQKDNGPINPLYVRNIADAVKFIGQFNADNMTVAVAQSTDTHHALGLCQFYGFNEVVNNFYTAFSTAKKNAKIAIKNADSGLTAAPDEATRAFEHVRISHIQSIVNSLANEYKRAHKQYLKDLKQKKAADERRKEFEKRDADNPNRLTDAQREYLFGLGNTDLDNAKRLLYKFGDEIRYLQKDDQWLVYDEKKGLWFEGTNSKNTVVMPYAKKMAELLRENIPANVDDKEAEEVVDYWCSAKRTQLTINYMKGFDSIKITREDLNKHNHLLCCLNGVIDLQTGLLYPFESKYLITQQVNAAFVPCSEEYLVIVRNYFRQIMRDPETRAALLRWLGYCLTGETREEKFMVWRGDGGNGKGVLSLVMQKLLGTYSKGLPSRALLQKRFDDADKATTALNGIEVARFAISEELPLNAILDVALIKNLTGSDLLDLRKLHNEYYTATPHAKINISGNYSPHFENVKDQGILRRMYHFPFDVTFGPEGDFPADPLLKQKLTQPEVLSALLYILVEEAMAWYREGKLIISSEMEKARQANLDENDFVAEFIDEYCVLNPDFHIKQKEFIDKLKLEYPAPCRRIGSNIELRKIIEGTKGIRRDRHRNDGNCFFGVGWYINVKDDDDNGDRPISSDDWDGPPNR